MNSISFQRISWRSNPNAVERGFDHYLTLIERRLMGEDISLVQSLIEFYKNELDIELRHSQVRGLMHRDSPVFANYVQAIQGVEFAPNIEHWEQRGIEDFRLWKDEFYKVRDIVATDVEISEEEPSIGISGNQGEVLPGRSTVTISRIIRDSALSRFMKSVYEFKCQICTFTFELRSGRRYAETHHIRPLGGIHKGTDHESNMIVLCPNHHSMMDLGALAIDLDQKVMGPQFQQGQETAYLQISKHPISRESLEYHLENIYGKV